MNLSCTKLCCLVTGIFALMLLALPTEARSPKKDFYEIRIYHYKTNEQEASIDRYLKNAYLPALHRAGVKKVGVFKALTNDTAMVKNMYVLVPFRDLKEWTSLPLQLEKDLEYNSSSADFINAPAEKKPFERFETILLDAFPMHTQFELTGLTNSITERIYELRSYESPTPHLYKTKVRMFNEGGEIALFKRLEFNAVFYGNVIAGSKMPNLMYMTSFKNMAEHDAHWKAFVDSPEWKALTAMPEYENKVSVSHIDIMLMHPAEYSDI